jgi:hypothetical protein
MIMLLQFRVSGRKKFYIGIVAEERDSDSDYDVSISRISSKETNTFMKPQVEDLAAVNQSQIKIILP